MSSHDPRDPRDTRPPSSPDHLELRGPVGGVTRIGPRAFALALAVLGAIVLIVIYGINKTTATKGTETVATTTANSPAPNPFATVPIVATPAPSAEPTPPLLEPPTPVPNVEQQQVAKAPAPPPQPQGPSPEELQREQQEQQAAADAEKARRDRILAAYRSAILTGSNQAGGVGFAGNGGGEAPVQLASNPGGTVAAPQGGYAAGGGAGAPNSANTLMGQNIPAGTTLPAQNATPNPNAFLSGPVGQYSGNHVDTDVGETTSALPANTNADDYIKSPRTAARSPYQLTAGTVIPAALVTGLDSELPGIVIGQVREDVYDTKSGKYMLVPRGTRLIGIYRSGVEYGLSRVFVTWRRMIFPDTTNIDLENMSGNDVEGYAGFGGTVDNHTGRVIGAALLSSIIATAYQLTQPQNQTVLTIPNAGQIAQQQTAQQITQVTNNLINKQLNIPPVVYVPKGYPFLVVVDRDIVFPGAYRRY
ncbi:MAG: TrbI/VirB10 family protein [Candidatus Eremiobacteraeota bacterium]|nr:TrbI/VirB10 family protein [Candidatus Eremiobacteraeota bacterium]